MNNRMMIEALTGIGTVLVLFVPIFLSIVGASRYPKERVARLTEWEKSLIRPLDLR